MSRKGLTPVIAMILLLMMTVAAAGASFYWLVRIQGELQGGTQQFQEQTFERMTSNIAFQDSSYNRTSEVLTLALLNTGTTKIPISNSGTNPKTLWLLLDSEQDILCSSDWSKQDSDSDGINDTECISGCGSDLALKELRLITLNLTNSECDISSQANGSLIFAKITFSGKTTAAGTFRK